MLRPSLVVLLLAMPACGGDPLANSEPAEPAAKTEVNIVATDFAFELAPDQIPAGSVETTLINEGKEPHQAGYYRLNDGVTYQDFVIAIKKDDSMIPQLARGGGWGHMRSLSSGDSGVRPGDDLEPGTYAVMCSIRDPESGKNHYELGMITPLTVNLAQR